MSDGDAYRLPNGRIVTTDDLERGKECFRCGSFISVRSELPPKPDEADYSNVKVTDYAGTENRVIGDPLNVALCGDCRDGLDEFLSGDDEETVEEVESRGRKDE